MEIRARYLLIGLFVLAVIVGGFGFVFWINTTGGLAARATYRVAFDSPVSGLLNGSSVLFNGLRVGEVTRLEIDASNPHGVSALIAIDARVPVRADTSAGLDFRGLTGVAAIALNGGTPDAPARNADKIDRIADGLSQMVGGKKEAPQGNFVLTPPATFPPISPMPET